MIIPVNYILMGGGLMQLAVYGSQDIFLTGTPQITFFKAVYKRNTNFAIEPIAQHFIGITDFDQEMISVVEKIGDLMSRIYLEIDIPKVSLNIRNESLWSTNLQESKNQYNLISNYYSHVYNFISQNSKIARNLYKLLKINNITINDINKIVENDNFTKEFDKSLELLTDYISSSKEIDEINNISTNRYQILQNIKTINIINIYKALSDVKHYTSIPENERDSIIKNKLVNILNNILYKQMYNFYIPIYDAYFDAQNKYQSLKNNTYTERYKFAWVEELGNALIDYVDFRIGDQVIDKQTGDWMIIFNKLFIHEYNMENYNNMIGNVKELTIFDDSVKNQYKLIIPLQFWFCRHTGLSLPIIALGYSDIIVTVKLKELSKLCYYEDNPVLSDMASVQSLYNIHLVSAKLYIDYIFLDTIERKRFAQSTHEYLIETIQYNEYDDIMSKEYNAHLVFSHPTKFMVWFLQPNFYRSNPTGTNKCQWNNFGTKLDGSGNPINSAYIRINTYNITDFNGDMKYFNNIHPYLYFNNSLPDGLNVYSFSIKPTIHQPSSSINLSRIDDLSIAMKFTKEFERMINNEDIKGAYFAAYVMSYNILRIMNGMAGLAFQNSKS
ncbi:major capsid-like protein [Moumouvirus maliensis]|nr:major capsid-like protein [Moumouvirus maliensis]